MLKPAFWGHTHTGHDPYGYRQQQQSKCCLRSWCRSLRKLLRTAYWFRKAILVATLATPLPYLIDYAASNWDNAVVPVGDYVFLNPSVYTSFTFILGFILTFRTNQAYQRYWEGATLLEQMMGNWYDAASGLVAFCGHSNADVQSIAQFQQVLARLLSLINAVILCELAGEELEPEALKYNLLDATGLDKSTLRLITKAECRPELIFQKIQTLLVSNMTNGVLSIPPPILTRAFQQMSNAMLNFHDATKLRLVPFPAPYIAVAHLLAFVHIILTPIIALNWTYTVVQAAVMSFVQVFIVVALLSLANGLDNPFDPQESGLDLEAVHTSFNQRMICLVENAFMTPPALSKRVMTASISVEHFHGAPSATSGQPASRSSALLADGTQNHTLRDLYARFNTETSFESEMAPPPEESMVELNGGSHVTHVTSGGETLRLPSNLTLSRAPSPASMGRGTTPPTGSFKASSGRPKLEAAGSSMSLTLPSLASPRRLSRPGNRAASEDSDDDDDLRDSRGNVQLGIRVFTPQHQDAPPIPVHSQGSGRSDIRSSSVSSTTLPSVEGGDGPGRSRTRWTDRSPPAARGSGERRDAVTFQGLETEEPRQQQWAV